MSCQGLSKNMLMVILLVALQANVMMMLEESQVGFKAQYVKYGVLSYLSLCLKDVRVVYSDRCDTVVVLLLLL